MSHTFRRALATVDVDPGFPSDLGPYMDKHADVVLKERPAEVNAALAIFLRRL
jgi:hypothetical protein